MNKKPKVLLILDGYGLSDEINGNAIYAAKTPVMDKLMKEYPFVKGNASGLSVGLPEGQMGNSEVGHLNMGAGRIVFQELTRISKEIKDGDFFENKGLLKAIDNAKVHGSALHLWGLLSNGGVHSHTEHVFGLLELAKRHGLSKVFVHCFLDGRDTPPSSGKDFVQELQDKMDELGVGRIASVSGRYYAMDRDNRWTRVEKAYQVLANGIGVMAINAVEAVEHSYQQQIYDEFMLPTVIMENEKPVATVEDGDSVIFFNFRPDRARELTRTFCMDEFTGFERGPRKITTYVCFTDYDTTIPNKEVAFEKMELTNLFGEFLSKQGLSQARIAETEKYAHVTFFFNGGKELPYPLEDRILVNSPKVATYDMQPKMSLEEVCVNLIKAIQSGTYDVIICNFANPDMVGHTGIFEACVEAIEAIDQCVGNAVQAIHQAGGTMFICADHGNAEQLIDPVTKGVFTAHTTNPVPFILVNGPEGTSLREGGCLADIAPTFIELLGLVQPKEMTGKSLLIQ